MIINDEHIKEAENLLIGGQEFDKKERVPFIKILETVDLLAVPGSGKTTALLAKLYCLSKHLPFNDGSGILVLAHTNAAVDEIEKQLKPICSKLFNYPNYVGTIQSFVNRFLSNSACLVKYDSYISINDNDIYEREAIKFFNSLQWKKTEPKGLKNKLFGRLNQGNDDLSFEKKEDNIKKFMKYFELNISERKAIYNNTSTYTFAGNSQAYYLELEQWKESLFKKGILNYRDSFYLGDWFISKYQEVIEILKKRFKYVFIDEMQDLEQFQIDIIDKIFHSNDSPTKIQRVGDINQSIYNSGKKVKIEADWQPRNQMYFNDSNRLTPEISSIVNKFTLDRQQDEEGNPRFIVNGLRKIGKPIKPHLIIFSEDTKEKLEGYFGELIMSLSLHTIPEAQKYGFKIIGWNAKWDDGEEHNNKLRLEDIFINYKKEANKSKEIFDSLSKYLQYFDKSKKTLEPSRKAILNALIAVLRYENKTYKTNIRGKHVERFYTKNELIRAIQNRADIDDYAAFKLKLYTWSFSLMTNENNEDVYNSIKTFIQTELKNWFDLVINQESNKFLGEQFVKINTNLDNCVEEPKMDVKIDIGTVHSAKGETHCATMYIETSYHDYETKKLRVVAKNATKIKPEIILPNPLLGQEHSYREGKDSRAKESLKMMYVGFSRPTHLLCFAALKDNVGESLKEYTDAGWEIIDLTT